jgi:aryl sulfotransferase
MRVYRGIVDSSRWSRFEPRPDDVIISTPSKCGTTWMQQMVGMILLDRVDFGASLSTMSPWLDVQVTSEDEVFKQLAEQSHRRFIKTHTPLDGIPRHGSWTYIVVFRHPLDAALSTRDHRINLDGDQFRSMIEAVTGKPPPVPTTTPPKDPEEFLRYWISNDAEPDGSGPDGLSDFANSLTAAWSLRNEPNVHLFHYDDLWRDLDGQMARLAEILGVELDSTRRGRFVDAATLDSMRARADQTAPSASGRQLWRDAAGFFKSGGRREWPTMLTAKEVEDVADRLESMVGPDAARWALQGGST